ncbi:type II secretion system F family protein [Thermoanaerobacter siderophilus]|uniref:Flp pilus assembly protein TadB n=1 Tax=Thermoanaerobacter siderophilus SR4 TaxID=880478 RepID=I8QY61_9THEO|nr:hypothetical protein [Thermoanaerobacter siderophilus]EIV99952.1 hypothetical protein ThesiDRAFT1_0970 [Thermoanaerobacter siderophilus SR4]
MIYLAFIESALLAVVIYAVALGIERLKFKKRLSKWQFKKSGVLSEKGSKLLRSIDVILARSGVKSKLPFLDAKNMMIVSAVLFAIGIYLFRRLGFAALFYASAVVYVPYAAMMLMSSVNAKKIKEAYLSFLTTFMGFYNIEGNIINALKSTTPYISEPLRSIIKRNVFLYEKTQMSVDECLENMAVEAGNREFRKFINFAKMNAKYGGNFNKALMKLREQGEKLFSLESIKAANASVGSMVILVMIIINLLLMMNISTDPDIVYIVKNTITGQAIAISNAVSIVFGLYMIKNINSSA